MIDLRDFDFGLARRWRRTLHDAWFSPADPRLTAICRIILFWTLFKGFRHVGSAGHQDFSSFRPIGILAALHVPVFPSETLDVFGWIFPFVATGALIGLFYPVTGLATALLHLYS